MAKAVGIDLGTTNSVVAVMEDGASVIIPNREGHRLTPSVVGFSPVGELLVGRAAKNQAAALPDRTVSSFKRQMGTDWTVTIDGYEYKPQELSARVLQSLKHDAEDYLGEPVTEAVITVPAGFNDAQRVATREAGRIAGLNVLRIINEPTAAALAHGFGEADKDRTILAFDLGGGTFDVTVLEKGAGSIPAEAAPGDGYPQGAPNKVAGQVLEVIATAGDLQLGGDDWDNVVVDWLVSSFQTDHGIDLSEDALARQRLREAAEQAKRDLSSGESAHINLPAITLTDNGPLHLDYKLSRAQLEEFTSDLLERCRLPFAQVLEDAKIGTSEIDHVILVGGSTRMPAVRALARDLSGQDAHEGVNPDEVVAVGAAIQGGLLQGDVKGHELRDVVSLSLGTEVASGAMSVIMKRNTPISIPRSDTFVTADHFQDAVDVKVFQGERAMAADNTLLGEFTLANLPPGWAGDVEIGLTLDIDEDGIIHASATEALTGRTESIEINRELELSQSEIDKMIDEAEKHAEQDRQRRDRAEAAERARQQDLARQRGSRR